MAINTDTPTVDPHPTPEQVAAARERQVAQRKAVIGITIAVIVILAIIVTCVVLLLQDSTNTAKIRDVFIIFMALETLLVGLVLVVLIIQIARLINILQNEIKPILDSTNETISNLRGTTAFLSDNLAAPVIKLNEVLAGFNQLLQIIGLVRKKP